MNVCLKSLNQNLKGDIHFTLKGIRLCGCLFLFFMMSCSTKSKDVVEKINKAKFKIESGDIIVRNGRDEVSAAVRSFNRKEKTYSHCGIVIKEMDTFFVYHELGGAYNPSQSLLRQPLDSFCNPNEVDKFAVYRYALDSSQKAKLIRVVQNYFKDKLPFDLFFSLDTDDRMYCSEFVFKSMIRSGFFNLYRILNKNATPTYISIDDLYLNDAAILIVKEDLEEDNE